MRDLPSPQAEETFLRSKLDWTELDRAGHATCLALYREALRLRPKDPESLTSLGQTLQKKGDDQSAVTEFDRALHLNPSLSPASLGRATSLEKAGRVDEAIAEFRHFLELAPTGPDAERVKGHLALLTRGRPQVK